MPRGGRERGPLRRRRKGFRARAGGAPLRAGFGPVLALARFDACPLLPAGAAITTGPTGNNFRDLRLLA